MCSKTYTKKQVPQSSPEKACAKKYAQKSISEEACRKKHARKSICDEACFKRHAHRRSRKKKKENTCAICRSMSERHVCHV